MVSLNDPETFSKTLMAWFERFCGPDALRHIFLTSLQSLGSSLFTDESQEKVRCHVMAPCCKRLVRPGQLQDVVWACAVCLGGIPNMSLISIRCRANIDSGMPCRHSQIRRWGGALSAYKELMVTSLDQSRIPGAKVLGQTIDTAAGYLGAPESLKQVVCATLRFPLPSSFSWTGAVLQAFRHHSSGLTNSPFVHLPQTAPPPAQSPPQAVEQP